VARILPGLRRERVELVERHTDVAELLVQAEVREELGDELDRLCIVINNMLDRLANYLERQRTFLANAAHELPSAIRGQLL
jgi:signal transduction histidine kinase